MGGVGRSTFSSSSKGGGVGRAKVGGIKLGATSAVEMSTFQVPVEVCAHGWGQVGCVCVTQLILGGHFHQGTLQCM